MLLHRYSSHSSDGMLHCRSIYCCEHLWSGHHKVQYLYHHCSMMWYQYPDKFLDLCCNYTDLILIIICISFTCRTADISATVTMDMTICSTETVTISSLAICIMRTTCSGVTNAGTSSSQRDFMYKWWSQKIIDMKFSIKIIVLTWAYNLSKYCKSDEKYASYSETLHLYSYSQK